MIGAVIAFRLLAQALSAIISRLTSPHRTSSMGAVRVVTLLIVVGIVASLIQGDDAAAQSPTPASPTPSSKSTVLPTPRGSARVQAVGGFVSGTVWDDSKVRNGQLDDNGRLRMIEMMWQLAYADGAVSDYEDNLIWRVADLLGVSSRERIALRQQVAAARGGDP